MNKTLIALGCVVLLLLTGCVFGDPTAVRSVSLNFQVPEGQSKVSLSVSDTQVQEALKLIDGVLVSRGFHRVVGGSADSFDLGRHALRPPARVVDVHRRSTRGARRRSVGDDQRTSPLPARSSRAIRSARRSLLVDRRGYARTPRGRACCSGASR